MAVIWGGVRLRGQDNVKHLWPSSNLLTSSNLLPPKKPVATKYLWPPSTCRPCFVVPFRVSSLTICVLRCRVLVRIISRFFASSKTGLAVGLMVTASHNAEPDNGIKMVDPNGGMLSQDWEGHAEVRCVLTRAREKTLRRWWRQNLGVRSATPLEVVVLLFLVLCPSGKMC